MKISEASNAAVLNESLEKTPKKSLEKKPLSSYWKL
jgi:hypothetical protein